MLEAGRIFEFPEQREPVLPIASDIPRGTGHLGPRCTADERDPDAAKDGGKGCENASANEGSTGQAQGNLRSHKSSYARARGIMSHFGWPGTDMCATTITL